MPSSSSLFFLAFRSRRVLCVAKMGQLNGERNLVPGKGGAQKIDGDDSKAIRKIKTRAELAGLSE